MTYLEWIKDNPSKRVAYYQLIHRKEYIETSIKSLEVDVALVESGNPPIENTLFFGDSHNGDFSFVPTSYFRKVANITIAKMIGVDEKDLEIDRWERDATSGAFKQKCDDYLRVMRDNESVIPGTNALYSETLPKLKDELSTINQEIHTFSDTQPFDWRKERPGAEDWYNQSRKVLNDMLYALELVIKHGYDDALANFVTDISKCGFSIDLYVGDYGASCVVRHRLIPKKHQTRRWSDMWTAILLSLLDFININWDELIKQTAR